MSYKRKLIRQAQRWARAAQGRGVAVVAVYHDSACAHWRGGPCDCAAEIGPIDQAGMARPAAGGRRGSKRGQHGGIS